MAGFAVVMTIFTYGIVGILGAGVLSLILFLKARRKLRDEGRRDHSLILKSVAAPFLGLAWLLVAVLIHIQASNRLAHQDCGLSGDPYVTLPNGYEVGSHNTYDGYIRAPGSRTDVPVAGPGYVRSIISLHLEDDKLLVRNSISRRPVSVASPSIRILKRSSLCRRARVHGSRPTIKLS
jgi:hypothetical protein